MSDPILTIEIGAELLWVLLALVIVAMTLLIGMLFMMRSRMAAMMEHGCCCMPPAEREPSRDNQDGE